MASANRKLIVSNKTQLQLLVEKMEQNPATARGQRHFGETKQAHDDFWEELSNELNCHGPPVRKRQDWQRVWTNYKQNLRRKISINRQNVQATGGGPSEEVPLTALEETVAGLLNTRTAVSPAGHVFGVSVAEDEADSRFGDENVPPRRSRTPQISKRRKVDAMQEQTRNQVEIIKKLDAIEKSCYKNYQTNKKILQVKQEKLRLLKTKEAEEPLLRKLDIELKQYKVDLLKGHL